MNEFNKLIPPDAQLPQPHEKSAGDTNGLSIQTQLERLEKGTALPSNESGAGGDKTGNPHDSDRVEPATWTAEKTDAEREKARKEGRESWKPVDFDMERAFGNIKSLEEHEKKNPLTEDQKEMLKRYKIEFENLKKKKFAKPKETRAGLKRRPNEVEQAELARVLSEAMEATSDIKGHERTFVKDREKLEQDYSELRGSEKDLEKQLAHGIRGHIDGHVLSGVRSRLEKVRVSRKRIEDELGGNIPRHEESESLKLARKIIAEKSRINKLSREEEGLRKSPSLKTAKYEQTRNELSEAKKQLDTLSQEFLLAEEKDKKETPAQDGGVKHTAEETRAEKEYLEKRKGGIPDVVQERGAKTIFNDRAANEIMQNDMDNIASGALEEKPTTINMEQTPNIAEGPFEYGKRISGDQTPLDFTIEEKKNPLEDSLLLTKARMEEVSKRQSELANETSPDAMLEKAELEEELASLEKRREEIESEFPKKSAYDTAMDKLWVENEAKRKQEEDRIAETAIGHGTQDSAAAKAILAEIKKLGGSQEQPVGTIVDSDEAVRAFEERVANEEKEKTHEELHKERTEAFNELFTKKMGVLNEVEGEAQARTEKTGWRFAMDSIGKVGERWNEFKKEHKYGYAAALILAGSGGFATGTILAGGALTVATAALRALSGIGVFYSKDKQYEREAKEEGRIRSEGEVGADRLKAVAWGVLMGGLLGHMLGTVAHEVGENLASLDVSGMAKGVTSESVSEAETAPSNETVAEAREQVWPRSEKMLEWKQQAVEENATADNEIKAVVAEESTVMPKNILPGDPELLKEVDKIMDDNMNRLFGSKGVFGFGAEKWVDSINMKDPDVGFANKSFDEIMQAKPASLPVDGERHFGIEDRSATLKMQGLLNKAIEDTGVLPAPNENAIDFLKRATARNVLVFMSKK